MSYRTEGGNFRPSERANERTSERTNERPSRQAPAPPRPPAPSRPQPPGPKTPAPGPSPLVPGRQPPPPRPHIPLESPCPPRTDGNYPPLFYRTSSPSGPLPCINFSIKKRRPRASNGQQYPLPCCAHFRFPKCVQQGRGYR